jgi:2Fe-2S ferredoxin
LKDHSVPQIVVLPHPVFCPEGAVIEAPAGKSVCDALLENDIDIEHACDRVLRLHHLPRARARRLRSLNEPEEKEEDLLDRPGAWKPCRACRARPSSAEDLVVELPKYTINHAAEKNH